MVFFIIPISCLILVSCSQVPDKKPFYNYVADILDNKNLEKPKLTKTLQHNIEELLKNLDSDDPNLRNKATEMLIYLWAYDIRDNVEQRLLKEKKDKNFEVSGRCKMILDESGDTIQWR